MPHATRFLVDSRRGIFVAWKLVQFAIVWLVHPGERAVRLRKLLEALGLTYLKFGQYLALRFDLLSADMRMELEKLFERVQPLPFDDIRAVIESELGTPLGQLFPTFSPNPLAAASIAQVHEAYTAANERVAVKVQRPGVDRLFAADMRLLRAMALIIDWSRVLGTVAVGAAVDEFRRWTTEELDFVTEGRTADRLRRSATANEVIPRIHWSLTARRVLTMEFVDGASLVEITELIGRGSAQALEERLPGVSLEDALHSLAVACLHQIFVTGFFHGDPHPGNLLILPDGRVAFVDFGIFGELTPQQQRLLRSYLENLVLGDVATSFRSYSRLFEYTEDSDYGGFQREAQALMRHWYAIATDPASLPQDKLAGKFSDLMSAVSRRNRVGMNMDILLFWRVFIVLDAVAQRLSSHFDLMREVALFFRDNPSGTDTPLFSPEAVVRWISSPVSGPSPRSRNAPLQVWSDEAKRLESDRNRECRVLALLIVTLSLLIALHAW